MRLFHGPRRRAVALCASVLLVACSGDDGAEPDGQADAGEGAAASDGAQDEGAADATGVDGPAVAFDVGVTDDPCPGTPNQDNGCIRLGVVTDFSGPFAAFGRPLLDGNRAFWDRVNDGGGVGGRFDVVILDEHVGNAAYDPVAHAAELARIGPEVLALAQTLGTTQTLGVADRLAADDLLAAVSTWWSGWEGVDNVVGIGSSYCVDGANGVDWLVENAGGRVGVDDEVVLLPGAVTSMVVVHQPDDYGRDALAGIGAAAARNGIAVAAVEQVPVAEGGVVEGAVAQVVSANPDVVWVAAGPSELGLVMAGAIANGYDGLFVGSHPTFNPALLASEVADRVLDRYVLVGPHESFGGSSEAHAALREAFAEAPPVNDGVTFGWMMSYPLHAALEAAVAAGDLTRAGLVAAFEEVTVDFEGALPERVYGGEPNETAVRRSVVGKASRDALLGVATVDGAYTGDTAAGLDLSSPCVEVDPGAEG